MDEGDWLNEEYIEGVYLLIILNQFYYETNLICLFYKNVYKNVVPH